MSRVVLDRPIVLASSLLVFSSLFACAPLDEGSGGGPSGGKADDPAAGAELLENDSGQNARFRSVARLSARMTCTAFLIDNGAAAAAPAYVLTNGHCVEEWASLGSSVAVRLDAPADAEAAVSFDWFVNTAPTRVAVRAIPFAAMKGVDLAVLELAATRDELGAKGIVPLPWGAGAPAEGAGIAVVGAPLFEEAFLRRAEAREGRGAAIVERNWWWPEVVANDAPAIIEGSSGSPVLDDEGRVFAMINTTTRGQDAAGACYLGAPCEVDEAGYHFRALTNYAMPVTALPACFGEDGRFDRARPGCPLDHGRQLAFSELPFDRNGPTSFDGSPSRWEVKLGEANGLTWFREKTGPSGRVRCRDPEGYSAPRPLAEQDLAGRPLPQEDGPYTTCLLGGAGGDVGAWWQESAFATAVTTYVDSTGPTARPQVRIEGDDEWMMVEPIFRTPELADYRYRLGPKDALDCAEADAGWTPYRRFPIDVPATLRPARFCLRAGDVVGNEGPVHTYDLE